MAAAGILKLNSKLTDDLFLLLPDILKLGVQLLNLNKQLSVALFAVHELFLVEIDQDSESLSGLCSLLVLLSQLAFVLSNENLHFFLVILYDVVYFLLEAFTVAEDFTFVGLGFEVELLGVVDDDLLFFRLQLLDLNFVELQLILSFESLLRPLQFKFFQSFIKISVFSLETFNLTSLSFILHLNNGQTMHILLSFG